LGNKYKWLKAFNRLYNW